MTTAAAPAALRAAAAPSTSLPDAGTSMLPHTSHFSDIEVDSRCYPQCFMLWCGEVGCFHLWLDRWADWQPQSDSNRPQPESNTAQIRRVHPATHTAGDCRSSTSTLTTSVTSLPLQPLSLSSVQSHFDAGCYASSLFLRFCPSLVLSVTPLVCLLPRLSSPSPYFICEVSHISHSSLAEAGPLAAASVLAILHPSCALCPETCAPLTVVRLLTPPSPLCCVVVRCPAGMLISMH